MAKKNITTVTEPASGAITKITSKDYGTIVTIPGIRTDHLNVLLIGTAPLLVHRFSEKLRKMILDKHMGEASAGRERKDPVANFEAARYKSSQGWDGILAGGLKAGIVDGFKKGSGVFMKDGKGGIRVKADDIETNLVRLILPVEPADVAKRAHFPNETGRVPRCREDVVRNDNGVVDIRHRPEYWPWAVLLRLEFLPTICSERQLLQAVATSGFTVGQCEHRPGSPVSKSGCLGTFRIATFDEVELFKDGKLFADYQWKQPALQAAE